MKKFMDSFTGEKTGNTKYGRKYGKPISDIFE